jgi:adenylate cyclase
MQNARVNQIKTFLVQLVISGVLTGIFLYFFIQKLPVVFFLGIIIGGLVYTFIRIYEASIKPLLYQRNFFLALASNTISYVVIIAFSALVGMGIINGFRFKYYFTNLPDFILSQQMLYGLLFGLTLSFVFNSYSMFDTLLGKNFLIKLLVGTYHKPFEEQRIFMFLDLKSSTAIAEKLGHKKFLSLLNDFFFDLAEAVAATKGEIYKYVGDEAIITWKMKAGLKENRCLDCFFMVQEKIKINRQKYLNKYNLIPEFKAGMHGGEIVTGEMGFIKKEIAYLGDVLNTTARIEASCNELGEAFIVSDDLLTKMQDHTKFEIKSLGELKFRGKQTSVAVSSVRPKTNKT